MVMSPGFHFSSGTFHRCCVQFGQCNVWVSPEFEEQHFYCLRVRLRNFLRLCQLDLLYSILKTKNTNKQNMSFFFFHSIWACSSYSMFLLQSNIRGQCLRLWPDLLRVSSTTGGVSWGFAFRTRKDGTRCWMRRFCSTPNSKKLVSDTESEN